MKAVALTILLFTCIFSFGQADADSSSVRKSAVAVSLPADAIKVFPNPAVNSVYITVKQDGLIVKNIFLYDKDGNRVLEQKSNMVLSAPVKININSLPQGRYYLVLETNKQPFRSVLIKQ